MRLLSGHGDAGVILPRVVVRGRERCGRAVQREHVPADDRDEHEDRDSERDEKLQTARNQEALVCDPYLIEVEVADGRPSATTLREQIRAEGPTTSYGIASGPRS